jgi:hypothetical protein
MDYRTPPGSVQRLLLPRQVNLTEKPVFMVSVRDAEGAAGVDSRRRPPSREQACHEICAAFVRAFPKVAQHMLSHRFRLH